MLSLCTINFILLLCLIILYSQPRITNTLLVTIDVIRCIRVSFDLTIGIYIADKYHILGLVDLNSLFPEPKCGLNRRLLISPVING